MNTQLRSRPLRHALVALVGAGTLGVLAYVPNAAADHSAPAHATTPQGPFNCALGPTAVPDDRWSSCAFLSSQYCDLGPTAVPDDRWTQCATN